MKKTLLLLIINSSLLYGAEKDPKVGPKLWSLTNLQLEATVTANTAEKRKIWKFNDLISTEKDGHGWIHGDTTFAYPVTYEQGLLMAVTNFLRNIRKS